MDCGLHVTSRKISGKEVFQKMCILRRSMPSHPSFGTFWKCRHDINHDRSDYRYTTVFTTRSLLSSFSRRYKVCKMTYNILADIFLNRTPSFSNTHWGTHLKNTCTWREVCFSIIWLLFQGIVTLSFFAIAWEHSGKASYWPTITPSYVEEILGVENLFMRLYIKKERREGLSFVHSFICSFTANCRQSIDICILAVVRINS